MMTLYTASRSSGADLTEIELPSRLRYLSWLLRSNTGKIALRPSTVGRKVLAKKKNITDNQFHTVAQVVVLEAKLEQGFASSSNVGDLQDAFVTNVAAIKVEPVS